MEGHTDSILDFTISNDRKLIVSVSSNNTVRRSDAESGAAIGEPLQVTLIVSLIIIQISP